MMRCQSSRAPQETPPLATSASTAAVQETCPHARAPMGRGRVDPAPPAPINSDPKERKRGGKKEGENDSKRGEKPKERETDREREEQPKQRNQKTRDIDKETERDNRGEGRKG